MTDHVEFNTDKPLPATYMWKTHTYSVCPDCIKPHEERQCNGSTHISHQACPRHEQIISGPTFDNGPLQTVRDLFQSKSIQKPLCSLASQSLWPNPAITYTHAPGCLYSHSPSYKIISSPSELLRHKQQLQSELSTISVPGARCPRTNLPLSASARHSRLIHLETALDASRAQKAIFFRRCDGVHVNGVGEVHQADEKMIESDTIATRLRKIICAREGLVQIGVVDHLDLALTAWAVLELEGRKRIEKEKQQEKQNKAKGNANGKEKQVVGDMIFF